MSMLRALLALLLLLVACSATVLPRETASAPTAKVPTGATPTSTPTAAAASPSAPEPTPEPTPEQLAQAAPFALLLEGIEVADASNSEILGTAADPIATEAVDVVVLQALDRVQRFLNAQFVDRGSFFAEGGVAALLDPATMSADARAGAGVLSDVTVLGTVTGGAAARAAVVVSGGTVHAVSLAYAGTLDLTVRQGTTAVSGPVQHEGVVSFAPTSEGLRVVAWDPTTIFGGALGAVL